MSQPTPSEHASTREIVQFETAWGRVECHDGTHVWFPNFFGDGIASKIKGRKTFVALTFDAPLLRPGEITLTRDELEKVLRENSFGRTTSFNDEIDVVDIDMVLAELWPEGTQAPQIE